MTLQIRRGVSSALPRLSEGELAYCFDTRQLFIGTGQENVLLTDTRRLEELETVNSQLSALNKSLIDQIAALTAKINELEAKAVYHN